MTAVLAPLAVVMELSCIHCITFISAFFCGVHTVLVVLNFSSFPWQDIMISFIIKPTLAWVLYLPPSPRLYCLHLSETLWAFPVNTVVKCGAFEWLCLWLCLRFVGFFHSACSQSRKVKDVSENFVSTFKINTNFKY